MTGLLGEPWGGGPAGSVYLGMNDSRGPGHQWGGVLSAPAPTPSPTEPLTVPLIVQHSWHLLCTGSQQGPHIVPVETQARGHVSRRLTAERRQPAPVSTKHELLARREGRRCLGSRFHRLGREGRCDFQELSWFRKLCLASAFSAPALAKATSAAHLDPCRDLF